MARPSARPELSNLTIRVLSAAVILPLAVALVWLGAWYFILFIALLGAAMGWEYSRLCGAGTAIRAVMCIMPGAAPVIMAVNGALSALGWVAVGVVLVAVVAVARGSREKLLLVTGSAYLGIAVLAITWLRLSLDMGGLVLLWIVAVVVATDVGAYFAGRGIGGPKLAPRVSPSKTWAGLLGGMFCAACAGWAVSRIGTGAASVFIAGAGAAFAIVAQVGDLAESAVKRHAGVKDSGTLIPGHGGILDRLDGFLAVAPAVALVTIAAGESPLEWF
ncbi:MAG: phosphatidate cytidylyltransferase [Alphaproteobacteria bacterium]